MYSTLNSATHLSIHTMYMYQRQVWRQGGPWGNGQFLACAFLITFVFMVPFILWELGFMSPQPLSSDGISTASTPTNYTPNPQLATVQAYHRARRQISIPQKDPYGAQILAHSHRTTVVSFDLCNVISCGENTRAYRGYDIYLCVLAEPPTGFFVNSWCDGWNHVLWNTGPRGYTSRYDAQIPLGQLQRNITLIRGLTSAGSPHNRLVMTLKHLHY